MRGFDETMCNGAEDWDLWQRVLRAGYIFVPAKRTTMVYRQKLSSMVRTMPSEHLAEATRLIDRANERCPVELLGPVREGVSPFPNPLSHYAAQLVMAKRIFTYSGLAFATGDARQLDNAISHMASEFWPIAQRHLEVRGQIRLGLKRAFGLSGQSADSVAGSLDDFVSSVYDRFDSLLGALPSRILRDQETESLAALLVQTAHQAKVLSSDAPDATIVTADREDGGSATDWLDEHELPWISLTKWRLSGRPGTQIVSMAPYGASIAEEIQHAKNAGRRTILVTDSYSQELEIGCAKLDQPEYEIELSQLEQVLANDAEPRRRTFDRLASPALLGHAAWTLDEYPESPADHNRMAELRDIHRGERCVIIGNGPSLNKLDLSLLADEFTFAVNGIFYAAGQMGFDPSYYVVEDTSVIKENLDAIRTYKAKRKLFPSLYRPIVGDLDNATFFMMNRGFYEKRSPHYCVPRFSTNAEQRVFAGQSVTTINLQLAYHMGFEEVALIGMDFSYVIPTHFDRKGDLITSTHDDPNHFHPDYFGKGKTWKDPKLDRVLANYSLAKSVFDADGRRIVNATPGGMLELFERVEYETLLA